MSKQTHNRSRNRRVTKTLLPLLLLAPTKKQAQGESVAGRAGKNSGWGPVRPSQLSEMMPEGMEGKKHDLSRQCASHGPVHALAEPSSRRSADSAHLRSKNVMLETIAPRAYSLDLTRGMGVAGSAVDRTAGSGRPPVVWVQSGPDAGDSTCAGATWSPASLPADYTYHRDDSKHSVVRSEDGEFHLSGYTLHVSSNCEGLMMPYSVPPPEETAVPTVIELSPKETMVRRSMELDSRGLPSRRLVEPPIPPVGGPGVECGVEEVRLHILFCLPPSLHLPISPFP
jgi:hypothetical protein